MHVPAESTSLVLDIGLAAALEDPVTAWTQALTPLQFENGRIVSNCRDYAEAGRVSSIDESVANQMVMSEYRLCDALRLLAGRSVRSAPAQGLGKEVLTRLDLHTIRSSLGPALADRATSLREVSGDSATASGDVAAIDTEDHQFELRVVAIADFSGQADPDWLLWSSDERPGGNYRAYASWIVIDPPPAGTLTAVPASSLRID